MKPIHHKLQTSALAAIIAAGVVLGVPARAAFANCTGYVNLYRQFPLTPVQANVYITVSSLDDTGKSHTGIGARTIAATSVTMPCNGVPGGCVSQSDVSAIAQTLVNPAYNFYASDPVVATCASWLYSHWPQAVDFSGVQNGEQFQNVPFG
jgi:hypothetical protein